MDKKIMTLIAVMGMTITIHAQTAPQSIIDSKMTETNPNQNYTSQGVPAESLRKSPAKQNNPKEPAAQHKILNQNSVMGQIDLSVLNSAAAGMKKLGRIKTLRMIYN